MTAFRRKTRLYKAMNELADFNGQSDFISENTSAKDAKKILPGQNMSPADNILIDFCRVGENIETVGYFASRVDDEGVDLPVVIIPDNTDSVAGKGKLSDSRVGPFNQTLTGLGMPKNGDFNWTVTDDLTISSDESKKDETPLHVVLISNPKINPSVINTEVCAVAMNSLPSIELSKAVPYLNVEFLSSQTTKDAFERGTIKGITTSRYLLGSDASAATAYEAFIEAPFLTQAVTESETTRTTYAGMDVFTAPQTMVPLDSLDQNRMLRDPFRPFLSVESFSVTVGSPQYGMDSLACSVTANLSLILHDRKRLKDIASLVTPGGFAKGNVMRITYGYAHPDGNTIEPTSAAQKNNVLYGHIIDAMRVSEIFTVSSADFSLQDSGEMKIEISAFSIGTDQTFGSIDVTSAFGETESFAKVQKELNAIQDMIAVLNSKEKFSKINTPTLLTSQGTLAGKQITKKAYNELVKYKSKLAKKADQASEKDALKKIDAVFKEIFDRSTGALKKSSDARSGLLTKIFTFLETSPDPFIVPQPLGFKKLKKTEIGYSQFVIDRVTSLPRGNISPKYISLGKLLTVLVGTPIKKEYQGSVDEIQMIFHGFNDSAAGVQDMNIASMPLEMSVVKKVLTKEYQRRASMSLSTLMSVINENFIRSDDTKAYGLTKLPNKMLKDDALKLIYGLPEDWPDAEFKKPNVNVSSRLFPGTSNGKETDAVVLRVEVFDTRATSGSVYKRLLAASSDRGIFYPLKRETSNQTISMGHGAYAASSEKVLDDYLEDLSIPGALQATELSRESAKSIVQYGKMININVRNVESVMTEGYQTIVYGGASTGIISANVSSRKDPNAIELAIARQNTRKRSIEEENSPGQDEFVAEVYPVECDLQVIGCPYFNFGQEYFIDFGTGTSIDNLYTVVDISHSVGGGDFTTNVKLIQQEGYPTLVSEKQSLNKTVEKLLISQLKKD